MKICRDPHKIEGFVLRIRALGEGRLMAELIICIRGIRVIRGWY